MLGAVCRSADLFPPQPCAARKADSAGAPGQEQAQPVCGRDQEHEEVVVPSVGRVCWLGVCPAGEERPALRLRAWRACSASRDPSCAGRHRHAKSRSSAQRHRHVCNGLSCRSRAGPRRAVKPTELPTEAQISTALEVTRWYLTTHYGTEDEPGMPGMFCD